MLNRALQRPAAAILISRDINPHHRELRYAGQVIKRYCVPAPNQELILTAFQEEGWPYCFDDPLPPVDDIDPKHRLQVTIKALNRSQVRK